MTVNDEGSMFLCVDYVRQIWSAEVSSRAQHTFDVNWREQRVRCPQYVFSLLDLLKRLFDTSSQSFTTTLFIQKF